MIHLILLSGGSGKRLWPLSNETRSKQFLKVLRDDHGNHVSMIQRVFGQISKVDAALDVTIATCASQEYNIKSQIQGAYSLVVEPSRRDTAPAIMLACAHLQDVQGAHGDDTVVVMPIDSYVDQEYFDSIVSLDAAVQRDVSDLVLLGVTPVHPSTKYGYIVPSSSQGDIWPVSRFVEKPDEAGARDLIARGALWNCGVFAFRLGYLCGMCSRYLEEPSFQTMVDSYDRLPQNSFDYEVVEKTRSISVIPYAGTWKDLGTWDTLTEEMVEQVAGKAVINEATCKNVHVVNELGLPMVVTDVNDAVVVATPDGILVSGKAAHGSAKELIDVVSSARPMYEKRRWGSYRVIDSSSYPDGAKSLTKELLIQEGMQLSYQRHEHRQEIWTIVSGRGIVVLDGEERPVRSGDVVVIPAHRLHAVKSIDELRIIEVQQGDKLVEEDITRFGNYWDDERAAD